MRKNYTCKRFTNFFITFFLCSCTIEGQSFANRNIRHFVGVKSKWNIENFMFADIFLTASDNNPTLGVRFQTMYKMFQTSV